MSATTTTTQTIDQLTVRLAGAADAGALDTLAQLDTATVPAAPALVAEQGGEIRAAISLADGGVVADPFHRTEHLVALLQVKAAQMGAPAPSARRPAVRTMRRTSAGLSPLALLRAS